MWDEHSVSPKPCGWYSGDAPPGAADTVSPAPAVVLGAAEEEVELELPAPAPHKRNRANSGGSNRDEMESGEREAENGGVPVMAPTVRFSTERPEEVSRHVDENGNCFLSLTLLDILTVRPRRVAVVRTSTRIEAPAGYGLVALPPTDPVVPGLIVCVGLVDSRYRGPLDLVVVNSTERRIEVPARRLSVVFYPLDVRDVDVGAVLHPTERTEARLGVSERVDVPRDRCRYDSSEDVLRVDVPPPEARNVVYAVPVDLVPLPRRRRLNFVLRDAWLRLGGRPASLRAYALSGAEYYFFVRADLDAEPTGGDLLAPSPQPLARAVRPALGESQFVSFDRVASRIFERRSGENAGYNVRAPYTFVVLRGDATVVRVPVTYRRFPCRVYAIVLGRRSLHVRGVLVRPDAWFEDDDELSVTLVNHGAEDYVVRRGERFARVVFGVHESLDRVVDSLLMWHRERVRWPDCAMDLIRAVGKPLALMELAPGDETTSTAVCAERGPAPSNEDDSPRRRRRHRPKERKERR